MIKSRDHIIHTLLEKKPDEAIEIVRNILWNGGNEREQVGMIYAISNTKHSDTAKIIEKVIKEHTNIEVRIAALNSLDNRKNINITVYIEDESVLKNIILNPKENTKLQVNALQTYFRIYNTKGDLVKKVLLKSKNKDLRKTAIYSIPFTNKVDPELQKTLEELIFSDEEYELQQAALHALVRMKKTEILTKILKEHDDPRLKTDALYQLSDDKSVKNEIFAELENVIFNEKDFRLREAAVHSLIRFDFSKAKPIYMKILQSDIDEDLKIAAIHQISSPKIVNMSLVPVLENILFKSNNEKLQMSAVYPLAKADKKRQLVNKVLRFHPNPRVKINLLHTLNSKDFKDKELAGIIEKIILEGKNNELVTAAIYTLGAMDKSMIHKVLKADVDDEIKIHAIQVMKEFNEQELLSILENIIFNQKNDFSIQVNAVNLIYKVKSGKQIPLLIKIAKDHKETKVRKSAIQHLGRSKDPRAIEALLEIIKKQ